MLSKQETLSLSPFMAIYDLVVPKDNMLRQMKELIDFTFILDELETKYCLDNGRYAISPIRMFKYLLLKAIYDISDVDVVERSKYDMSFKYFLDMAPEEDVIEASSLTKFRRLRLQDVQLLDLLIHKTVELAITQGVLKSKTLIVDATHTKARYQQKSPKEFLQEKSKQVRKVVYQFDETMKSKFPTKPTSQDIQKEVDYCHQVIQVVEENTAISQIPSVQEKINVLKEVVEDYELKINYSADPDARVGYKSKENPFFGYKTHLAMSDERLITAVVVTTGEKSDGNYLQELVEKSEQSGIEVDTILGDTAYSGKENLTYTKKKEIQLISRLHPVITNGQRKQESKFEFNKDADLYVCPAGHLAKSKSIKKRKNSTQNTQLKYFFDIEKCKVCPLKEGCYKAGAKTKSYSVSLLSNEHIEQEVFQETESFKQLAKERYKIEAKNSEIKNRHGYDQANATGLFGMQIQAAATLFVVNMKRILKLMDEKSKE